MGYYMARDGVQLGTRPLGRSIPWVPQVEATFSYRWYLAESVDLTNDEQTIAGHGLAIDPPVGCVVPTPLFLRQIRTTYAQNHGD
jgi:hypothetical protein